MENEQKDLKINSAMALTDNELIAQFMGLPLTKEMPEFGTGNWKEVPFQKWKYHESWDWLMGVIEKITQLHNDLLNNDKPEINDKEYLFVLNQTFGHNSIENVYTNVVEFIKWYNSERGG